MGAEERTEGAGNCGRFPGTIQGLCGPRLIAHHAVFLVYISEREPRCTVASLFRFSAPSSRVTPELGLSFPRGDVEAPARE